MSGNLKIGWLSQIIIRDSGHKRRPEADKISLRSRAPQLGGLVKSDSGKLDPRLWVAFRRRKLLTTERREQNAEAITAEVVLPHPPSLSAIVNKLQTAQVIVIILLRVVSMGAC